MVVSGAWNIRHCMLIEHESQIRLIAFISVFAVMAIWEFIAPYRHLRFTKLQRWPHQFMLIIIDSVVLKLVFPIAAVGIALWAASEGVGLLNQTPLDPWLTIPLSIVLLDLAIYGQHRVAHRWSWFWRIHRTHHIDTDFDLTTGFRFHPIEMVISMLYKMLIIILLGAPAFGVMLFEIILSGSSLFNHSNIVLPKRIEPIIRGLVVTPEMHRIHHSTLPDEHNSNYGFFFSCWDRLFRSYSSQASNNDQTMPIGLEMMREPEDKRIDRILMIPFRRD